VSPWQVPEVCPRCERPYVGYEWDERKRDGRVLVEHDSSWRECLVSREGFLVEHPRKRHARISGASLAELLEMFAADEASQEETSARLWSARMHDWPEFLVALRWMHSSRNTKGLDYTYGVPSHVQPCACQSCQDSALTTSDVEWLAEHGWKAQR
jgi:hypothetical protein